MSSRTKPLPAFYDVRVATYSERECEILDCLMVGMSNRNIGILLKMSADKVKNYLRVIYDKSGMSTRLELALWWLNSRHLHHDNC